MFTSRRTLLAAGLATTAAGIGLTGVTGTAAAAPHRRPLAAGTLTDLGVAMQSINVRFTGSGPDGAGGTNLYALSDGNPVAFSVLDTAGHLLFSWRLPDTTRPYGGGVFAIDGAAYFTARSGSLTTVFRYDHAARTVTEIMSSGSGSVVPNTMIRNIIPDGDTLYFACYPRSEIYAYTISTGAVRAFGRASDNGGDYAWGFTRIGGTLYVGTGIKTAQLVSFDIASGARNEIPLPVTPTVISDLGSAGELLLVPLGSSIGVYDTTTGHWRTDVTGMDSGASNFATGGDPRKSYFRRGSEYFGFDADTRAATALGFQAHGVTASGFRPLLAFGAGGHDVIANFRQDGRLVVFDPSADTAVEHAAVVSGSPVVAHSIGRAPDGQIWVGAYLSAGVIASVDPATGVITQHVGPEQSDTFAAVGPYLMISKYPNGVVHRYDTRRPWSWGSNPDVLVTLIGQVQDRIFTMVEAGGLLAAGSVPEYGNLGGALTIVNPETGAYDLYRNVVPDQSVCALAYRDGVVYGGTTTRGGLSSVPTTTEGHLFEFDLATRQVTRMVVPVPGDETVSDLVLGAEANVLIGMTYGCTFFRYDIKQHVVTSTVDTGIAPAGAVWGRTPTLRFSKLDGHVYGVAGQKFFRCNAFGGDLTILDDSRDWASLEMTPRGEIFLIDSTNVHRYA